ncbi:phenazine biosynthesis protein PhzF family [Synechococcus sp. PCC 7502]|uniref:PhzF family phenazine biosynthesis protein n=1 Tax=Synechococcus sp. PCC 7502 TaxID=1173263 RepID=UPI00029FDA03|nr:PhzF family phenazine biosynthesis protein [Synechococcus sp. PCC 7502]AFY72486.1 phenazine biosynthesis protein PhzF family [Synechococcus sp. PCC 7502]
MQIFIIDAFTKSPFQGNPAATVLVEEFPSDRLMQKIAAEMNLSETAFAQRISPNYFHLRWFTPLQEVNLCGHATLAMAHYLKAINEVDINSLLTFKTRSGDLHIRYEQDLIVMDFPASYFEPCSERSHAILEKIFANYNHEVIGIAAENITVLLETESQVLEFAPNFAQIVELEERLIITAIANPDHPYDFVSRFFAPNAGINEDPVTGSAHCCLTPYWAQRLQKYTLKAKQLSKRTGELELAQIGDRIQIKGYAVTVLKGVLENI